MPDDILIPIPNSEQPTHRKPRWHQIIITNGEEYTDKQLVAQGQTIPVRVDGETVTRAKGGAERDPSLDVSIAFDPSNPDDLIVLDILDRKIKAAHAAKVAALQVA